MPKFRTKNFLSWYFWAGMLKKTIVIFEITTLEFVKKTHERHLSHDQRHIDNISLFEDKEVIFDGKRVANTFKKNFVEVLANILFQQSSN